MDTRSETTPAAPPTHLTAPAALPDPANLAALADLTVLADPADLAPPADLPEPVDLSAPVAPSAPMVLPERIGGLPSGPSGLGTSGCRIGPITPVLDVPEPPAPPAPPPTPEPVEVLETPPVQVPETPEASPVEVAAPAEPQPELRSDLQPELHADVRVAPEPSSPSEDGEDVESRRIKGLKFHPPLRDDRGLADRVNERLMEWAEKEVELYPDDELRAMFLAFDPGRSVVMCHPDSASFEHLVAAGMLYIGENAVDDYFCEPDLGGTPDGLGARLLVAQTAIDPLHTAKEQVPKWLAGIASHPALRCMRSAMNYFERIATPAQAHRYRHDICNLYLGYCAEAACIQTGRTPAVWEYLAHRQFNNFRPCLTITDAVGGYELPAGMFARPDVQRATGLASNASTIVNDLFSLRKEMAQERVHHSLPTVIADEEGCDIDEAFQKTIDIHNELMDDFESLSALLAPTDPVLARYLAGLSNWVAGNHEWHSGLVGTRYATSP